jgi:HEPN domain-containing protein/predicted nucleotidyltransferase
MERAVAYWVELAEDDLGIARDLRGTGHYLGAAYHCQQALEKMLKALVQHRQDHPPPRTHDLKELAELVGAWERLSPAQQEMLCRVDHYGIEGRYPTSEEAPLAGVGQALSQQLLAETEELMGWLRETLDSGPADAGATPLASDNPSLVQGPVVEPSSDVLTRVERYLARLRERVRVDAAWVFGSQVMGTTDTWSDIDLAVISRDFGRDRRSDRWLVWDCRDSEEGRIDVLPFSWDEYVELPRGSFLREVLQHGRLVAGVPRPTSAEPSQTRE